MRPLKQTAATDAIFLEEIEFRERCRTNKQLAKLTGFTPSYCAKLVSRKRRAKGQSIIVSRETIASMPIRSKDEPT